MIKQRLFLLLLVAAAAAACSKDNLETSGGKPGDLVMTFDAGTSAVEADPEEGTRAGYDGAKSIWQVGDAIGVTFDATNKNLEFTQVAGTLSPDGTKVTYTGNLINQIVGNVSCMAYYPYSSTAVASGLSVTTTFPATQTYNAAGGYQGIPLFATYSGNIDKVTLQFKNLFSIVKLTLSKGSALTNTVKLQRIVFQGNNDENISGPMTVDMSGSTPVVSYTGTGKTITLDCGAGVILTTAPQTFYIAVPAINYTKGYSYTFITDAGQVTKSAKNSGATYAINKVYKAPALTIDNIYLTTTIPDGNLRDALKNLGLITILDGLGHVGITSAGLQASSIDVSGKGIADLTGLSNFPALVSLNAGNNNLASVDLSNLTLLTNLDLSKNQLTGLNLAANTALLSLDVSGNQLTSLNVSANTLLTSLNASGNQLTGLNLAANLALLSLDVSTNALTSLDLHNNILLTSLKAYGNPLVTLNISGLKALLTLNLVNGVNSVDTVLKTLTVPAAATVQNLVSDGVALTNWLNVVCNNNPNILSISLKNNTGLLSVTATGNTNLASLDVSGNATLTNLTANGNVLTSLNMTGDLALLTLNVASNKLASINVATQTLMTSIDVSSNLLTSLDLHNNIALLTAKVYGNPLATLNISGLTLMTALYLDSANPTTNAISGLTLTVPANATVQNLVAQAMTVSPWTAFVCQNNPTIQSIDLSGNVKLLSANASGNANLTSLNLSGNLLQTTVRTSGSTLTTLNISGMPVLATLYLNTGSTNCINLGALTIPTNATVRNLIADGALVGLVWTRFVCSNNPVIQTISLKNIIGLLHVTVTNNTALTALNVTGSSITSLTLTQSGNAAGFTVTGLVL